MRTDLFGFIMIGPQKIENIPNLKLLEHLDKYLDPEGSDYYDEITDDNYTFKYILNAINQFMDYYNNEDSSMILYKYYLDKKILCVANECSDGCFDPSNEYTVFELMNNFELFQLFGIE